METTPTPEVRPALKIIGETIRIMKLSHTHDFATFDNLMEQAAAEIEKYLASAHQQGAEKEREKAIEFGKWLFSLSPAKRCTVHPPAGSGLGYGLYEKSVEDLFNDFNRKK